MASSSHAHRKPHPARSGEGAAGPSSSSASRPPPTGPRGATPNKRGKKKAAPGASFLAQSRAPTLEGPFHNEAYIEKQYSNSPIPLKHFQKSAPKGPLHNFCTAAKDKLPEYKQVQGVVMDGDRRVRVTTVEVEIEPRIIGVGDHEERKKSMDLAALSAVYQLQSMGIVSLDTPPKKLAKAERTEVVLSDGTAVNYEKARSFMDYYCRRFGFSKPDIETSMVGTKWEAIMTVGGRRIGLGAGANKKSATITCFLDVTKYLESCDAELWKTYAQAARTGADLGMAPKVAFNVSAGLEDAIGDLCSDIRKTSLYRNRPSREALAPADSTQGTATGARRVNQAFLNAESQRMLERRKEYLADPALARMRSTRMALPVYTQAKEVLSHIANNDVTICMAATGSGKTTQIPQMILDEYIDRGEGAMCNVVCTQPRRLAAISVADRVAKERGETVGKSIGYHVRFDAKLPQQNGSVTFCTTGVFLKRLQSVLSGHGDHGGGNFDNVTHIVVDEVHERDVDTDLLLVVLKQIMAQKKAKGQKLKIILMSATIDPTLFQNYFPDDAGVPARVISVPGRSFPVTKHFMEDYVPDILQGPLRWVVQQDNVARYLYKELGSVVAAKLGARLNRPEGREEDLELPYPLIGAAIAHVLNSSDDGHVLVFLPGMQEIMNTQKALLQPLGPLGINFNDAAKYSLHLLHSTIPLAEQQAIFEPPPPGVRRVILSTNIAETSVTIPDVVCVIDTAKIKEQRYDPERHMSSLVSAWVGSSNLNQRAGRAGRHRPGEYFGLLSKEHADALSPYQTVEMKRVDLSNVVMHVKALNFPGMTVEEVLAAAIEPPEPLRVNAAMKDLQMVGALDSEKNLTSLGRVLLQIPVDAQMGRLVLYGSFFRCLDEALTLAAILTNRDPFMSPMHLKVEAAQRKNSWSPEEFRSDAMATLRAFNAWWALQSRGEYISANRFCSDNFLSKPTLLMIQKIKGHLLQALYRAGVIDVSAGGQLDGTQDGLGPARTLTVPPALNANKDSLPLLAALIAIASQPKFAIRLGEKTYRTSNDKVALIHPSSVNHRKRELPVDGPPADEKQLYAFAEKRRNDSTGSGATTFLVTTTRLDPLTYILFGAYNVQVVERGLECDDWLPVVGDVNTLDDVQRLKTYMESCMLRVFEGITMSRLRRGQNRAVVPREEEDDEFESGDEGENMRDYTLSRQEVKELDFMTRDVVNILNRYSDERISTQSRTNSRAGTPVGTPMGSPSWTNSRLPGGSGSVSGYSTPNHFQSRPGTPSRLRRF
ncbi:hypothetical protein B0H34DRAFT_646123 [Crassisporium funariophilum]|nr:hypothetical protein B0H34DRAFT_646123 [Crassisporium funariophilum]